MLAKVTKVFCKGSHIFVNFKLNVLIVFEPCIKEL